MDDTRAEDILFISFLVGIVVAVLMLIGLAFYINTIEQNTENDKVQACEEIESSVERRRCLLGV